MTDTNGERKLTVKEAEREAIGQNGRVLTTDDEIEFSASMRTHKSAAATASEFSEGIELGTERQTARDS
jgi:hypothetical protein